MVINVGYAIKTLVLSEILTLSTNLLNRIDKSAWIYLNKIDKSVCE